MELPEDEDADDADYVPSDADARTVLNGPARPSARRPRTLLLKEQWASTSTMLPTPSSLSMSPATLLCRWASASPPLSLFLRSRELPGLPGGLVPRTSRWLKGLLSLRWCCPWSTLSSTFLVFNLFLLWRTLQSRISSLVRSLSPQSRSSAR